MSADRMTRTMSTGSTVTVVPSPTGSRVLLDHRDAPDDICNTEAGRIVDGAFQPAPFCAFGMYPDTLHAIADLVEEHSR